MFTIYTDVQHAQLGTRYQGFSIGLRTRCPPGPGRDPERKKRADYWKHARSKRLTSGSLVTLVLTPSGSFVVCLANLVSTAEDIPESAKHSADYIQVKPTLVDPEVEIESFKKKIAIDASTFALLIDNGVMFEPVRQFLKTK